MTEILRTIRGRSVFSQTPWCPLLPRPTPVWSLPLIWSHLEKTRKPLKLIMSPGMHPACFIAVTERAGECVCSAEARERPLFKGPVATASCCKNSCGFNGWRKRKGRVHLPSQPSHSKPGEEEPPSQIWELVAGSCVDL